jgi:hypothetical protein
MDKKTELGLTVAFYISKFDKVAYAQLPFGGVTATHKEVGTRLDIKPTSIQNMRDEFDPINDNPRKGWHQRHLTPTRREIVERYGSYSEPRLRHVVFEILELPIPTEEWSAEEIRSVANTYFYLVLLNQVGALRDLDGLIEYISTETLHGRDNYSVLTYYRYITRVLRSKQLPFLEAIPSIRRPRRKIIEAVTAQIDQLSASFLEVFQNVQQTSGNPPSIEALRRNLDALGQHLTTLDSTAKVHRNHNRPPEVIEDALPFFAESQALILKIKRDLENVPQNRSALIFDIHTLTRLGMKLAIWIGDRVTDFGKAAAVAAGTAMGAAIAVWATGLAPQLLQTIKAMGQLIGF